jgi:hypothetical protein
MLIRILSSDWSISIQVPSKLKKNRMHFYTWTNEIIEDLIDFMEIHPIVWNVKDKSYHDKDKRKEVMQEIAEKLDLPGTYIFL